MLTTLFNYEWPYWQTIGSVTFDGTERLIIVNEGVTELDISRDVYSAWKEWVSVGYGAKFAPAIRSVGGDPIDVANGEYAGDLYFLINGWKLLVDLEKVAVTGILYSDNYTTAYYLSATQPVYPAKVSNIVSKQITTQKALTAENIAEMVAAIWDAKIADYLTAGSTGAQLNSTASPTVDNTEVLTAITNQTTTINAHTTSEVGTVAVNVDMTDINNALASQTIAINSHTDTAVSGVSVDTSAITTAITASETNVTNAIDAQTITINAHTTTEVGTVAVNVDMTDINNAIEAQTLVINAHTDTAVQSAAIDTTPITNAIASQTTTLQGNIEGIKDNINAHTTLETSSITFANTDVYDYIDAQTVAINAYTSTEIGSIPTTDLTPVLNAIAGLNDVSLLDIETSTVLAKQARLEDVVTIVSAIPTTNLDVNLTPVLTAIAGLNDVTPAEVRAAFNAADFKDKNTELEIHAWLDSYTGKDSWKATVDLSPILTAIGALQNLSLLDIEGSTVLAKQSTLLSIATAIANIPTTDNVVDLTPVLNAIAGLNDITPAEVRAAFDPLDFKDKNTEAEIHAWLGTYPNKDQWKASTIDLSPVLTAIQSLNNLSLADFEASNIFAKEATLASIAASIAAIPTTDSVTDITPVLTAISNLNDVTPAEVRAAFNAVEFQSKNTEAEIHSWLNSYTNKAAWKADQPDFTPILAAIQSLENISVADIEASTVLGKQTSIDTIVTLVSALENTDLGPVLNAISGLNDVTAAEVRAAFNVADFKDKNTELEIHTWLDSYLNKDDWKADAQTVANTVWDEVV